MIERSHGPIVAMPYFGTIDGHIVTRQTRLMARYTSLIGKRMEVSYRAGDILLSAAGVLVTDSGESIYLEEHFIQRGNPKTLRIEIPYPCIVRMTESAEAQAPNQAAPRTTNAGPQTTSSAQS